MRASDQHEGFPATLQRGARWSVFLGKAGTVSTLDNWERGVPDAVTGLEQTWEGDTGLCDQEELSGARSSEPLRRCDQLSASFQGLATAWLFAWGQLDRSSHV